MPVWVKPVFGGWDGVGTSISNLGNFYWDFDINKNEMSFKTFGANDLM